jgi:hypothetical protein
LLLCAASVITSTLRRACSPACSSST